ncbi:MAG: dienelactone hydrolase family protein [Acuticoccus sp.]
MRETTQHVQTSDGAMPVEVFTPSRAEAYPGVIFYMDVFGFRDELRRMCRRYASAGYVVFLPGLYHRHGNPSFRPSNSKGDGVPEEARKLNAATTIEMTVADTTALIHQAAELTDVAVPVFGTVGYCMGGRHALACAAENPRDVHAAASLHGGQLISASPSSMERLIERIACEIYFGFASDDPTCPPADQALIAEALARATTPGRIDRYAAQHGWTFPERHCFDEKASEDTWEAMFHLLRTRLWARIAS